MICVWPRVKSAEPCVRGLTRHLALDRADLLRVAAVGAALLDRDLAADEVLVDRLGRRLTNCFVSESLTRGLAVDRRRADRERQLDGLDDPLEEQLPLRRLQLLRVLLGVGQRAQVVLELLAHRPARRRSSRPCRGSAARLALTCSSPDDVLLGRVHRERRRELVETSSSTTAAASRRPASLDPLADRVAVTAPRAPR